MFPLPRYPLSGGPMSANDDNMLYDNINPEKPFLSCPDSAKKNT
jgi:hypothetical protein